MKIKGIPISGHHGPQGDVDARVEILAATALGRGRVANPIFGHFYRRGSPGTHFEKPEWTSGPVWTRRNEEKNIYPSMGDSPGDVCEVPVM